MSRGKGVKEGTGCGAGFVGAVWAVAGVVVDLGGAEGDGGVADAGEGIFGGEEVDNCVYVINQLCCTARVKKLSCIAG